MRDPCDEKAEWLIPKDCSVDSARARVAEALRDIYSSTTKEANAKQRARIAYGVTFEWSTEDLEWVGRHEDYPSLSHLDLTPASAVNGIIELVLRVMLERRDA